jgi:hypothetical protein
VGYHGRASSVVCSGTNIVRPRGQILKDASSSSSGGTSEARPPSHAGPHTTASARCTPFLKDFSRRLSPLTPRF